MLSRIAESLFWLARYIERAEYTARILDVNFHTVLEQSKDKYRLHWDPLIVMAGEEERFRSLYGEADARAVFEFLAFRQDNPSSIVQCITKARENARTIRDIIADRCSGRYPYVCTVSRGDRPARQFATTTVPFMDWWYEQKYVNVPSVVNVCVHDSF